jgi:hypothetical protein
MSRDAGPVLVALQTSTLNSYMRCQVTRSSNRSTAAMPSAKRDPYRQRLRLNQEATAEGTQNVSNASNVSNDPND